MTEAIQPERTARFSLPLLSHLPAAKQNQLQQAVDIILKTLTHSNTPSMIILFGSYARGDWVEVLADDGEHYQYQSDFDLLLVTKNEALATKIRRKRGLYNRLVCDIATPINLITEDIHRINGRIRKGLYFYTDMLQEGVVLYDSGAFELAEPVTLMPQERKQLAQEDFDYCFEKVSTYKEYVTIAMTKGDHNEAAFFLHQIAERFYIAVLLVFTRYQPNTHDLRRLGQQVASIDPYFLSVFPQGANDDKARFELLRSAYVNARYNREYKITRPELEWLIARVKQLQVMTEQRCKAKVASF